MLPVVLKAEKQLAADQTLNKEYLSTLGYEPFKSAATRLLLGNDSQSLKEGRVISIQCLGGTGGVRLGGEFLARIAKRSIVYASNPTWSIILINTFGAMD